MGLDIDCPSRNLTTPHWSTTLNTCPTCPGPPSANTTPIVETVLNHHGRGRDLVPFSYVFPLPSLPIPRISVFIATALRCHVRDSTGGTAFARDTPCCYFSTKLSSSDSIAATDSANLSSKVFKIVSDKLLTVLRVAETSFFPTGDL